MCSQITALRASDPGPWNWGSVSLNPSNYQQWHLLKGVHNKPSELQLQTLVFSLIAQNNPSPRQWDQAHMCLGEEKLLIWVFCPNLKWLFVCIPKNTRTAHQQLSFCFSWKRNDFYYHTPCLHSTTVQERELVKEADAQIGIINPMQAFEIVVAASTWCHEPHEDQGLSPWAARGRRAQRKML